MENTQNIEIRNGVTINEGVYLNGLSSIVIEEYVSLSVGAKINTAYLDPLRLSDKGKEDIHLSKKVKIGKYTQIGMGAIILPGVEIGQGTIVGAGSVVTKSFGSGLIIAGNPARIIREVNE